MNLDMIITGFTCSQCYRLFYKIGFNACNVNALVQFCHFHCVIVDYMTKPTSVW